jgi:RNA polymerase sigma-70 factor (ECF subfamily)
VIDLDCCLEAIAIGDRKAFGAWVAGAEHSLRDSLRSFAASVDVEAVVQEVLLRVWEVAPRVKPDGRPNALLRFAATAAFHLAVSEARRRGRVQPPGYPDPPPIMPPEPPGPTPPDPLLRRLIEACVKALPPKLRQALDARLAAAGGKSDREIANDLGIQLNTLLQNFTRARKSLATCLGNKGVDLDLERA